MSTITTASAPAGSGAPVMIATACPRPTEHAPGSGQSPAFTSPTTSSLAGSSSKSAARTAYPSRAARAKGGKSRSAATPSARTRPNPANRSTVCASASAGCTPIACCSTKCRAASKLNTRAAAATEEEGSGEDMEGSYRARVRSARGWKRAEDRQMEELGLHLSTAKELRTHKWNCPSKWSRQANRSRQALRSRHRNACRPS